MEILVIATKAPWPPVDGGRLLLWDTLEGLAGEGVRAMLVAPVDPKRHDLREVAAALASVCEPWLVAARPAGAAATLARSVAGGLPWTIARHALVAVRREVAAIVATRRFDVVHAEQLQALEQAAPAAARGIPVVLRAQNVESDLWAAAAGVAGAAGPLLALEARRLAAWEGRAVRRAALTLALTGRDAARLEKLSGGEGRVLRLAAPFPTQLSSAGLPAEGKPAVVLVEGAGWLPNREGAEWFLREAWPLVRSQLPEAVLHLYGSAPLANVPGLVVHPPPADSVAFFPPGSFLVVPLRVASGLRMKILEAWSRGIPVVGTPEALAGLEVKDGVEALVVTDAESFAAALTRLGHEPTLASTLVTAARATLAARHDPHRLTQDLIAAYTSLLGRQRLSR